MGVEMPSPSHCEVAWAAGLFEGEGTFTTDNRGTSVRACLHMTDQDVVERFAAIVGGKVLGPYGPYGHSAPRWQWEAYGENALRLMDLFEPYLGQRRLARCAELRASFARRRAS